MNLNEQPIILTTQMLKGVRNFQCDCACVTAPAITTADFDCTKSELMCTNVRIQDLPGGYKLLFNYSDGNGIVVVNPSGLKLWKSYQQPRKSMPVETVWASALLESGVLAQPQARNLAKVPNTSLDILSAWLHLTDVCNLRCTYCYLPHIKSKMSFETGQEIVDSIFRSTEINGFKSLLLKYAGGEPLLAFSILKKIQQYAEKVAAEKNINLESVVLSNGTLLTQESIDFLKAHQVRLMISLDGLESAHNAQRIYAGGKGTFSDVVKGIDLAQKNGLIPDISITITGNNADHLPDLMRWILQRELPFSLNFYRECDLSSSHSELKLEEEKVISGVLETYKIIENNLPAQSLLGALMDRANLSQPHQHTCGVGQNYLVFDPTGQVFKCQMEQTRPLTTMLAKDPLQVIRQDQIGIQNIPVSEKENCNKCNWRHTCAGGCPLVTFRATGRYDLKSPNCDIYHRLFPEVLRLEGLRLLKYSALL